MDVPILLQDDMQLGIAQLPAAIDETRNYVDALTARAEAAEAELEIKQVLYTKALAREQAAEARWKCAEETSKHVSSKWADVRAENDSLRVELADSQAEVARLQSLVLQAYNAELVSDGFMRLALNVDETTLSQDAAGG